MQWMIQSSELFVTNGIGVIEGGSFSGLVHLDIGWALHDGALLKRLVRLL